MEKKREWRSSMEDTMIQKEKEERRGIKRTRNVDDDDDDDDESYRKKRGRCTQRRVMVHWR